MGLSGFKLCVYDGFIPTLFFVLSYKEIFQRNNEDFFLGGKKVFFELSTEDVYPIDIA